MSKKDDALKLALEALKEIHPGNMTPMAEGNWNKAITAIREALADHTEQPLEMVAEQPAQDQGQSCYCPECERLSKELAALKAQQQEPKCGAIIEVFGKDWRLEYMSLPVGKHKLYTQQYNYTIQPQRKPLTPQSPCEMTQAERKMFRLGWLECEAAHGITGEQK